MKKKMRMNHIFNSIQHFCWLYLRVMIIKAGRVEDEREVGVKKEWEGSVSKKSLA